MTYPINSISLEKVKVLVSQSCPTHWDSMDYSLPGSFVHGILQARILEWVFIPFSRQSSWPRDGTCISYVSCTGMRVLYHSGHPGSPKTCGMYMQWNTTQPLKEWNNAICGNIDVPRDCHTEWSKSDRGEILYNIPYIWNLKRNDTTELTYKQ